MSFRVPTQNMSILAVAPNPTSEPKDLVPQVILHMVSEHSGSVQLAMEHDMF